MLNIMYYDCISGHMRPAIITQDKLPSILKEHQVMTIDELVEQFECSSKTIFRNLQKVRHITSYNKNRTGITLSDMPRFDRNGLWNCKQFYFSRWKTLNETIQNVVEKSSAGLTAGDIHDLLHVGIYHHVSSCVREKKIYRNLYFKPPVYCHMDLEIRQQQQEKRQTIIDMKPLKRSPLSKKNIIKILLVIIEHHAITVEKVMPILEAKGLQFSKQSVKWLFDRHNIEKKGSR